jgi:hypothetical protein
MQKQLLMSGLLAGVGRNLFDVRHDAVRMMQLVRFLLNFVMKDDRQAAMNVTKYLPGAAGSFRR